MAIVYSDIHLSNASEKFRSTNLLTIYYSIIAILNTKKGERLFRPDFGNTLEDHLFDLIDEVTALEIYRRIIQDVTSQEPRVQINLNETKVEAFPLESRYQLTLVADPIGLSGDSLVFFGDLSKSS